MKIAFRRTKAQIGALFQETFCSPPTRIINLEASEHLRCIVNYFARVI